MSRGPSKADKIRAQIADLEAEKARLELDYAAKVAGIKARISQSQTILGLFTGAAPRRKSAPRPAPAPTPPAS